MLNIIDVIVEASPASVDLLKERIRALEKQEDPTFTRLQQIEHLHFMSMQVFDDRHFDSLLVFENNFDGLTDEYWRSVERIIGPELRSIFACTKPALETNWCSLFKPGSKESLIPFLKHFSQLPSASHIGATGMVVDRIKRERDLCQKLDAYLQTQAVAVRGQSPQQVHSELRQWALPRFDWLQHREVRRTAGEWAQCLLAAFGPPAALLVLLLVLRKSFPMLAKLLVGGSIVSLVALIAVIRHLEKTDYVQENPQLDANQLAMFAKLEDQIVQNHLASMVLVKPGVARSIVMRSSLEILKRFVAVFASDGYLGSMRTIHFAHWTLVGNGGRLLFLSNFDGSWQSYLDDFVDKAHRGLTLAWANCVGFPRTSWLVNEGASHGHDFKAWARQSQTETLLWFSAYTDLTVNQVWRNAAIADGLRQASMNSKDAEQWAQLL